MGSGKSTVGPILANTIGWDFFDLDIEIERKIGKTINDIFAEKGESFFRIIESEVLSELSQNEFTVISLGGGAIASQVNLKLMKEKGIIIYLYSSPENLYLRLRNKENRPAFNSTNMPNREKNEFIKKIVELMEIRKYYYEQADITINTDENEIGQTIDIIKKKIYTRIYEKY